MPRVRYVANNDPSEGTTSLLISEGRTLQLGRGDAEIDQDELNRLRSRYTFEEVDEQPEEVSEPASTTASSTVSVGSTPSSPASSAPAATPAVTPLNSPTPSEGN